MAHLASTRRGCAIATILIALVSIQFSPGAAAPATPSFADQATTGAPRRRLGAPATLPSFALYDLAAPSGDAYEVRASPVNYVGDGKPSFFALLTGD